MYKIVHINFVNEIEFQQQMSEHADAIHHNTLYGIDKAFNADEDVTFVALLNDDSFLAISKEQWMENLENTLDYFILTEEYEKSSEVKQLMNKLS